MAQVGAIPFRSIQMNRFFYWLAIVFFVVSPFWYGAVIYHDCTHPETWGDWQHDPRIYLPMLGAVVILALLLGVHISVTEVRERRGRKQSHP
jgi:hypothetical protein